MKNTKIRPAGQLSEEISAALSDHVKIRLEDKLSALYLSRYSDFLPAELVEKPVCGIAEDLISTYIRDVEALGTLSAAWKIWTFMKISDRHQILHTFYLHMKLLMVKTNTKGSTAVFCKVFIREFAPILSSQLN